MTRTLSIVPPPPLAARAGSAPALRADRGARHRARGRRSRLRGCAQSRLQQRARCRRSRRGRPRRSPECRAASASASVASILRPFEHAVALDVGVDDRRDAGVLEAAAQARRRDISEVSRPALDRDRAVARVDADGDPAGIAPRRLAHEIRIAHRGGAEDDAARRRSRASPRSSPGRGCRRRAAPGSSTAARIASTACGVDGLPAKAPSRSTTCSQSKPCASKCRACAAGSSLKTVACAMSPCYEAHAAAVLEIDRGEEDHGRHLRKLAIRAGRASGSSRDGTACRRCCRGRRWR